MAVQAAAAGFKIVTGLLSSRKRRKARKALLRLKRARASAKRRVFMANFRNQQQELLLGGAREGGFESSLFQGQSASLATQGAARLGRFDDATRLQNFADASLESAERTDAFGSLIGSVGTAISAARNE